MARTLTVIGIIMTILLIGCEPLALKSTIMELSDPPTWSLSQAPLMQGGAGDQFGVSVDISANYMIIGAPLNDSTYFNGVAYIYVRNGDDWQFLTQLESINTTSGINFGIAVAITEDYAVVGASGGSVHQIEIFKRIGSTWSRDWSRTETGAVHFGEAVDVYGDYAIVGDYGANKTRIYYRDSGFWVFQEDLDPSASNQFGYSVSLFGDYAVVGVPQTSSFDGAAEIYERSGTNWLPDKSVEPPVSGLTGLYGTSVSISGSDIIIGAPNSSTVYFYRLNGSTWGFHSEQSITGVVASDSFGWSVSVTDRVAAIGAPGTSSGANVGCVYMFEKYGDNWIYKTPRLAYSKGENDDYFGNSVAVHGTRMVIGAYSDTNSLGGTDAGTGFVYTRD